MKFAIFLRTWSGMSRSFPYPEFDHVPALPPSGETSDGAWEEIKGRLIGDAKSDGDAWSKAAEEVESEKREFEAAVAKATSGRRVHPIAPYDYDEWQIAGRAAGWFAPGTYGGFVGYREPDHGPRDVSYLAVVDEPLLALAVCAALNADDGACIVEVPDTLLDARLGVQSLANASVTQIVDVTSEAKSNQVPPPPLPGVEDVEDEESIDARRAMGRWAPELADGDVARAAAAVHGAIAALEDLTPDALARSIPMALQETWADASPPWVAAALSASTPRADAEIEDVEASAGDGSDSAPQIVDVKPQDKPDLLCAAIAAEFRERNRPVRWSEARAHIWKSAGLEGDKRSAFAHAQERLSHEAGSSDGRLRATQDAYSNWTGYVPRNNKRFEDSAGRGNDLLERLRSGTARL